MPYRVLASNPRRGQHWRYFKTAAGAERFSKTNRQAIGKPRLVQASECPRRVRHKKRAR
jgi:hypothetical protein